MPFDINRALAGDKAYSARGAQMGRRNYVGDENPPVYLQRVTFVDGDYDRGGAYWGGYPSPPLWCAMDADGQTRIFVRAKTRDEAKQLMLDDYPELTFKR